MTPQQLVRQLDMLERELGEPSSLASQLVIETLEDLSDRYHFMRQGWATEEESRKLHAFGLWRQQFSEYEWVARTARTLI